MKQIFIYLSTFLAVFAGCNDKTKKTKEVKSPNIIYIMADDMGYGDLGCYGQDSIQTPNIDKMAEQGMRFTQHYAASTVCAPSRCGLITGMHMGHAEIRGNMQAEPHGQVPLTDQAVTVAELMKDAGYITGMIGKWGLGIEGSEGDPNRQGWDFFYGYTDQVLAHNYYPEYLVRNGEHEMLKNEVKYLDTAAWHKGYGSYATKKVEYSNDLFTDEALSFIKENRDTSFFLYLPYTIPHNNGEAPEGQKQEVPDYGIYADKDWPSDTKGYAAMITRLDDYVGQIFAQLKAAGIDKNTLVIFTSDNGPMQESHEFTKFFNSNGNLRGGKRDLYEGGIRVPFIAQWPGKIKPGTESTHISAFWDFLPTACELAGINIPDNTDGISYLPELLGKEQKKHEYLYWEFPAKSSKQAVRKVNWKAVRTNLMEDPDALVELYDLSQDIAEENNIADQHPEVVKDMRTIMEEARTVDPDWKLIGQ